MKIAAFNMFDMILFRRKALPHEECIVLGVLERGEVEYYETNLNLETNNQVMSQWNYFSAKQHKRRRAYFKEIKKVN